MTRDARIILLLKADYSQGITYLAQTKQDNDYFRDKLAESFVALGSFDGIISYPLELNGETHLLQAVQAEKRALAHHMKGAQFFYPLFIVQDWDCAQETESFWKADSSYFFVTSIYIGAVEKKDAPHYDCDISGESMQQYRAQLEGALRHCVGKGQPFRFLVYKTLQISEFMLVIKSDHVLPVLRALNTIYSVPDFYGYTRTICSLPFEKVNDPSFIPQPDRDAVDLLNIRVVSTHLNELLKLRRSEEFLDIERENTRLLGLEHTDHDHDYFTLGDESFVYFSKTVSSRALYRFTRLITARMGKAELSDAVVHLQTQIGVKLEPENTTQELTLRTNSLQQALEQERNGSGTHNLKVCCAKIQHAAMELKEDAVLRCAPWFNEFIAQMEQLYYMSTNNVLDSVCFLVLGSANFFCKWLKASFTDRSEEEKHRILLIRRQNINTYLEGLARLTSRMFCSDAIVSHRPICDPPCDNLCTGIVEYCSGFFRGAADYFNSLDHDSYNQIQKCFAHILVPLLCRHMKVYELFYDSEPPTSHMLYLELPMEVLSNPCLVIAMLTHEAAHYLGDRLRHERYFHGLSCIAMYIALRLRLPEPALEEAIAYLAKQLDVLILRNNTDADSERVYFLTVFESELKNACDLLLRCKPETIPDLTEACLKGSKLVSSRKKWRTAKGIEQIIHNLFAGTFQGNAGLQNEIGIAIGHLVYFLRECYADVMMIHTLGVEPKRYVELFLNEFHSFKENPGIGTRQRLWLRLFMVMETHCKDKNGIWRGREDIRLARHQAGWEMPDSAHGTSLDIWEEMLRTLNDLAVEYPLHIAEDENGLACAAQGKNAAYNGMIYYCMMTPIIQYLSQCLDCVARNATEETRAARQCLEDQFSGIEQGIFGKDYHDFLNWSRWLELLHLDDFQ